MSAKPKRPPKPTVFLSHCSNNRRELLALKRLLDERSGGLIEFFLSSDDHSIAHGTIWSAEVRAALDRMSLMLIFVSSDALKSGWTYFEAGYGLHKLDAANIYCLPGTDKAALPSPFDILQNRNLHSQREVSLLIEQVNERLGATMAGAVTKEEFEKIFKKPSLVEIATGPSFEQVVESVVVEALGPPNSIEVFARVCRSLGEPISSVESRSPKDQRYSTGVRFAVDVPRVNEEQDEFPITREMRKRGETEVSVWGDMFEEPGAFSTTQIRSVEEIEEYNVRVRTKNEEIRRENAERQLAQRKCVFVLSPINISVPIGIVDRWFEDVSSRPRTVDIELLLNVGCESKVEAIGAKIRGSELALRDNGTLLWRDRTVVGLPSRGDRVLTLQSIEGQGLNLSEFNIQELVSALFQINILLSSPQKRPKRKG
jgi:hypothetical protein